MAFWVPLLYGEGRGTKEKYSENLIWTPWWLTELVSGICLGEFKGLVGVPCGLRVKDWSWEISVLSQTKPKMQTSSWPYSPCKRKQTWVSLDPALESPLEEWGACTAGCPSQGNCGLNNKYLRQANGGPVRGRVLCKHLLRPLRCPLPYLPSCASLSFTPSSPKWQSCGSQAQGK